MDKKTNIVKDAVDILSSLKIVHLDDITDSSISSLKIQYIGKGKNAVVFKSKFNNRFVAIKIMELFIDTPLIKTFSENMIISQTGINDIVISHILSLNDKSNKHLQDFIGYTITKKSIIMVKEYLDYDLKTYINNNIKSEKKISSILIQTLLIIRQIFQIENKGYFVDAKIGNVLIRNSDVKQNKYITYTISEDGETIKIKNIGAIPVLTDFGASILILKRQFEQEYMIIKRHTDWKKCSPVTNSTNNFHCTTTQIEGITKYDPVTFDAGYDLFCFMFLYIQSHKNLSNNIIVKEYEKQLKKKGIYGLSTYKSNAITINDFLNSDFIKKHIKNIVY